MSVVLGTILYIYNPNYSNYMSRKLFEELASQHYILYYEGKLVVTNKFLREFGTPPPAEVPKQQIDILPVPEGTPKPSVSITPKGITLPVLPVAIASPLRQFILDAEVPEKWTKGRDPYYLNRFNTKAEKELIKILKSGVQYQVLLAATKLYYKSGGFPKTIANYFLEGVWSGCYEDMIDSLKSGTVQQHIEKGLDKSDEEGFSRYQR